jgi:hypothetical protein
MEPKNEAQQGQKTEETIRLLALLKEKLYCGDVSKARRAAHNLSWMQEDGLEMLKTALLSEAPGATKNAAGYGLRHMNGRMKKAALEILQQGLNHPSRMTRDISSKALKMLTLPPQPPKKRYMPQRPTPVNRKSL